jgi:ATP-dependent NAD(P)H-hydrate dehydratase
VPRCVLSLSIDSQKGSSGRIAVLGGSDLLIGAAYFAGMAALRTGADIISRYTEQEAAIPLKCYSPDYMVRTVYSAAKLLDRSIHSFSINRKTMIDTVLTHLKREKIHCLVVGPDLGVSRSVLIAVAQIICREVEELSIYLVFDSDAFSLFSEFSLCD